MPKSISGSHRALHDPNWWEFGHVAWSIIASSVIVMCLVVITTSFGVDFLGTNRSINPASQPTSAQSVISAIQHRSVQKPILTRTIYVAPNGSDQSNGLLPGHAFKTIQRAVDVAYPGTTIKIASGIYTGAVRTVRDGTAEQPIALVGEAKVELLGDNNTNHLLDIQHSYIQVKNLHINGLRGDPALKQSYVNKLVYIQSQRAGLGVVGATLSGLLIENAGGECVRLRYGATETEVSNSTIRNCGVYDFKFNDGGKNGEGVYVGTAPEQLKDGRNPTVDRDGSSRNWIHNNIIETQGNECVDIKEGAEFNVVEKNSCSGQLDPESAGFDSRGNHNYFFNNHVFNSYGAGFRLGGDTANDGLYNTVQGNKIQETRAGGIKFTRLPQASICDNTFIGIDPDRYFVGKQSTTLFPDSCQE